MPYIYTETKTIKTIQKRKKYRNITNIGLRQNKYNLKSRIQYLNNIQQFTFMQDAIMSIVGTLEELKHNYNNN